MSLAPSTDASRVSLPAEPPRERRGSPRLDLAGRTDRGLVRERNEDQFVIADLGRWMKVATTSVGTAGEETMGLQETLLVVADGIGGRGGGDVASAVALDSLLQHSLRAKPWLGERSPEGDALIRVDVESFVVRLQARLMAVAAERDLPRSLGTTLTAGYLRHGHLIIAHVGDSRAYVLRKGTLSRLTRDHTLAAELGACRPGAEVSCAHVLVNAIGGNTERPRPELSSTALEPGDRILLCTDGLYGAVTDERIAQLLGEATSAEEATRWLVDEALANGGEDNITVVAALG